MSKAANPRPTQRRPQVQQPQQPQLNVEQELVRTQERIRLLDVLTAAFLLVVVSLGYVALMIAADNIFHLSDVMRQVMLGVAVLGGSVYAFFAIARPLWLRINPYFAARALEKSSPESKNSVTNWLDLRDEPINPYIREAIEKRAAMEVGQAEMEKAVPTKRPKVLFGVLAVALIFIIILRFLFPEQFSSLIQRAIYPFEPTPIPTNTRLQLLDPYADEIYIVPDSVPVRQIAVKPGESVVIKVRPHGRMPEQVALEIQSSLTENPIAKPMTQTAPREKDPQQDWFITLGHRDIPAGGLYIRAVGGDGKTPLYQLVLSANLKPKAREWIVTVNYPKYTRKPPQTRNHAAIEALVGSNVELAVTADQAVKSGTFELMRDGQLLATYSLLPDPANKKNRSDRRLSLQEPLLLPAELLVGDKPGAKTKPKLQYRVNLTNVELTSGTTQLFPIDLTEDETPFVTIDRVGQFRIEGDQKPIQLSENDVVSVDGEASDDFAVDSVKLRLKRKGGEDLGFANVKIEEKGLQKATGYAQEPVKFQLSLDLTKVMDAKTKNPVKFVQGDRLELWVEATDTAEPKRNVGKSKVIEVEIIAPLDQEERKGKEDQAKQEEQKRDEDRKQEEQKNGNPPPQEPKDQNKQDQQDQGKPDAGKPDAGKPDAGKPDAGKPDAGKPDAGKPDAGKPDAGKPDAGKPDAGKPDDGKPDAGKPDAGKPDAGKPDAGKPDAGKPDAGKPDAGKPDAGKPDAGKPDAGKPDAGKPDAGKPDAGKPDAGKPDAGKPDAGKPDAGKPDAGKPDAGKPDAGKPDAGKPDAGKPDAGKPDAGKPDAGKPDAGKPDAGKPDAGKPDAGKPDAGKPDAGKPDAGKPDAGKPDAGKPDAGKPDAGKPDAGKPDAGKPDAGKPDAGKPDAGKPDAGKPDAGKPDAGKPDAGKPDAGKPDAGKPDAGKPDAGKPDAGKPDAGKPDAGKPDAGKPDAGKPDAGKPDAGKPDAGKPDAGKPDAGKPDAGKPDAGKPDAGKPDAGKPDAGKPDAGKPDAGKPDAGKPDAGKPDAGKPDAGKPDAGKPDAGKPDAPKPSDPKPGDGECKDPGSGKGTGESKNKDDNKSGSKDGGKQPGGQPQKPGDGQPSGKGQQDAKDKATQKNADDLAKAMKEEKGDGKQEGGDIADGSNAKPGQPGGKPLPGEGGDQENVKNATDLMLENLKDQLAKGKIDRKTQKALEKMNLKEEDAKALIEEYQQMRGKGTGKTIGPRKTDAEDKRDADIFSDPNLKPPQELAPSYDQYSKQRQRNRPAQQQPPQK